jgi:hypothetical protein
MLYADAQRSKATSSLVLFPSYLLERGQYVHFQEVIHEVPRRQLVLYLRV